MHCAKNSTHTTMSTYRREMGVDALRIYLRELRIAHKFSQDALAEGIGLARRTLIEWEMGRTDDLKSGPLVRAVSFLGASFDDVKYLVTSDADEEEAKALAHKRMYEVSPPPDVSHVELEDVLEIALRLKNDRKKLAQLAKYGKQLIDEK